MSKFHQFLSSQHRSIFSFPDDNFQSKNQCLFTRFGMCIGIVELWFGMAYGQISSIFAAGLGSSVGCAVRLETRRTQVQPPPRLATFFHGD